MEIKLMNLVAAEQVLLKLSTQPLKIVPSYTIAKVIRKGVPELQLYYQQKEALFKKYGKEDEQGTTILPENETIFKEEFAKLLEMDINIPVNPIKLEDISTAQLTPQEIASIDWLLTE